MRKLVYLNLGLFIVAIVSKIITMVYLPMVTGGAVKSGFMSISYQQSSDLVAVVPDWTMPVLILGLAVNLAIYYFSKPKSNL